MHLYVYHTNIPAAEILVVPIYILILHINMHLDWAIGTYAMI